MGPLSLIIGVMLVLGAFGTDTAPGGTHNLGLLQQQLMTLHCGLALIIVSAIRWEKGVATVPATIIEPDEATLIEQRARANKITYGIIAVGVLVILWMIFSEVTKS